MRARITMDGLEQVVANYKNLADKAGRQLAAAAIRSGLKEIAREIKKRIDPRIKHVKTTVGYRFKTTTRRGITAAKVGFNVGNSKARQAQRAARSGRNQGGIGITGQNVYWFIAGTKERFRRQAGVPKRLKRSDPAKPTGQMPAQQPGLAADAYRASAGAVRTKMQRAAQSRLKSIVRRLERGK